MNKQPLSIMSAESTNNQGISKAESNNYHDKIPNYLNLACCVNGYSNLTTYDSKIRQDINKSREVSPIRPSTSSLQYCKQSNLLTPPTLLSLNDVANNKTAQQTNMKYAESNNKNQRNYASEELKNGKEKRHLSYTIQQRVERLYGSEALSQVIYSPNKGRKSVDGTRTPKAMKDTHNGANHVSLDETDRVVEDLPVFRHLNAEFLSQLPKLSPKRQIINNLKNNNNKHSASKNNGLIDDDFALKPTIKIIDKDINGTTTKIATNGAQIEQTKSTTNTKDGHYFLKVLKGEQERLLHLADNAEKLIEELIQKTDTSEDTLGLLRSASGKARLLATKKMKQFEGLCMDNINPPSGDKFTTTGDDLQGFWDMVKLQVDNVDSMYVEIETLKQNNWQKPMKLEVKLTPNVRQLKTPGKSLNKGTDSKSNTPMSAAALKREEQRKQLMEMKRKNKLALAATKSAQAADDHVEAKADDSIEILVNNPTST